MNEFQHQNPNSQESKTVSPAGGATVSDKERFDLVQLWGRIAPFEPNNWDWSCRWQVWEADHGFLPEGFLAPDPQDGTWDSAKQGSQQANATYDFRHQR